MLKFELKMMKDYHNLYLKCDILLLPDVFEKFRNNSLKNCGLRPSRYLSAPDLSWEAMLTLTKVKLKLVPDADMYIFIERGARGIVKPTISIEILWPKTRIKTYYILRRK